MFRAHGMDSRGHKFKVRASNLAPRSFVLLYEGLEAWTPSSYIVYDAKIRIPDLGSMLRAHGLDCRVQERRIVWSPS